MQRPELGGVAVATPGSTARPATPVLFCSIQNCRGIAALLVVVHHLGGIIASPKYFNQPEFFWPLRAGGIAGVGFFFVLSGFIISSIHWPDINRPAKFPVYLFKRIVRIYPVYWMIFLALWLLMLTGV